MRNFDLSAEDIKKEQEKIIKYFYGLGLKNVGLKYRKSIKLSNGFYLEDGGNLMKLDITKNVKEGKAFIEKVFEGLEIKDVKFLKVSFDYSIDHDFDVDIEGLVYEVSFCVTKGFNDILISRSKKYVDQEKEKLEKIITESLDRLKSINEVGK